MVRREAGHDDAVLDVVVAQFPAGLFDQLVTVGQDQHAAAALGRIFGDVAEDYRFARAGA
ncbi:hypothetical protein D3C76_1791850 [compost metagenome]